MAEKTRPSHLPPTSESSQLLTPPVQVEGHVTSKSQTLSPALSSHGPSQPDIALHARPAASSVTGTGPSGSQSNTLQR